MNTARRVLLTGSLLAVAACGSHTHAPLVYGDDPARQTRIYHSKEEILAEQRAEQARLAQASAYRQQTYQPPRASSATPVQLTPVSAIYLDEPGRSAAVPVRATTHLHKAKGYVEVQRGDTVYALARKFSVSPEDMIDENDLNAPYQLSPGQALKLPKGAMIASVDRSARRTVAARDRLYKVKRGDTLYSISKSSRVPVENIASANRLRRPYTLDIGRQLVIPQAPEIDRRVPSRQVASQRTTTPKTVARARPVKAKTEPLNVGDIARNASYTPEPAAVTNSMFSWPVRGAIISEYGSGNLGRRNDGVNIAAPVGSPVRAAAAGNVVYRGSELEGFGNLLLIKHEGGYVTAYAHNDTMLVKKGDPVRKGQMIAKVGQSGAVSTPQLHFEIRQELKTVDPLALLGKQ